MADEWDAVKCGGWSLVLKWIFWVLFDVVCRTFVGLFVVAEPFHDFPGKILSAALFGS